MRPLRAGYLFVDDPKGFQVVFMHELAHVLGLSDRYIEGIDDAAPGHPFRYVGQAIRQNPPFSKKHVDYVLNGRTSGPVVDATYDPQANLMSTRSYQLSTFQRNLILQRGLEPTYADDDVMVLLFDHSACNGLSAPSFTLSGCRFFQSKYRPTSIIANPTSGIDEVTFQTNTGGDAMHNAFFKSPGLLGVRYQGARRVIDLLMNNDGLHGSAMEMVLSLFRLP